MQTRIVPVKISRVQSSYKIKVGSDLLSRSGEWAVETVRHNTGQILIVSNRRVWKLYGDTVQSSLERSGFETSVYLIGDGERFKSLRTLEGTLRRLSELRFTRTDTVIALGGGVVGDLAGFAASLHLRGINLLQIPTTLLAMIDSSVGGKTGVNTAFGKNLVGSFYQPRGVLIDVHTLRTLPPREITAGLCEAIKQGAISGQALFRQTQRFLETFKLPDFRSTQDHERFDGELARLIDNQVRFKAAIVQNDELEDPENLTPSSRKILNFGHTFAHALEKATDFRYLRHGEAVGYGIRFATELSKKLELIVQDEVNSLNDVVRRAGVLPALDNIDRSKVQDSFNHDKKRVGKSLQWVLLRGIGKPVIISDTEIPRSAISSTLKAIFKVR